MKLYLVQHGDAVAKELDPERPLSERGRQDVQRMASFLRQAGVQVSRILHSGKKRAEQTASLLAGAVLSGGTAQKAAAMDPLDPTDQLAEQAGTWPEDTMLVGHLPFMAKLVSRLLVGNEAFATVTFEPGTVVCMERGDDKSWHVVWMIRPRLLHGGDWTAPAGQT